MNDSPLFADYMVALIITIGLFIGSLGIFDSAASADFSPVEPGCHNRYQVTFKAVLYCDQTLDEKGQATHG